MDENQPNENADLDKQLENIKEKNVGIDDTPSEEKPAEEEKPTEEGKPEGEEAPAEEAPAEEASDPEKEGEDEESEAEGASQIRPEKYIPIKKYTDEKKTWKETEKTLNAKIVSLAEKVGNKTEEGSEEEKADLKKWAEENSMSFEAAEGLVKIARQGMGVSPELLEKISKAEEATEQKAEETHFGTEYDADVNPVLEKEYPKATKEQKEAARDLMDKISHTRKNHIYELPYLYQKNKKDFEKIFSTTPARKGPEGDADKKKVGAIKGFDPDKIVPDPKTGRYDFSSVNALESDEKDKAISSLDPLAYVAYIDSMDDHNEIEVHRDGRKILLK